jgi:hypothetical protein
VKSSDDACPFCGAATGSERGGPAPRSLRASRSALLAVGASALLGTAACSADVPPTDDAGLDGASQPVDATPDAPSVQPLYGAVIPPQDATDEAVRILPVYGGAPVTGH